MPYSARMSDTVTTEVDGRVLRIGLNRAHKRNAFDLEMLGALAEAYTRLEDDDDLWCGLLFAHGEHFTGGLDLAQVGPAVAAGQGLFPDGCVDPLDMLGDRRRRKPVVCAVQGYCLTIGIELMLASDVRVAARDCRFSQLEVARGILPFGGATLRFPALCGWGNAMRWILTGDFFDADEALRIGLAQQVVDAGAQLDAAAAIAGRIAAQAPLAVQATRGSAMVAVEQGADAARAAVMGEARRLMATDDAAEGVRSFVERRQAVFTGR